MEQTEPNNHATHREVPLYGAILLPPLAVAVTDPDIFFAALDTAGTFGISLLCGVLPAAMAWSQRYGDGGDADGKIKIATLPLVPGGKATLAGQFRSGQVSSDHSRAARS